MQSPLGPELKQALLGFRALPGFKAQNPGDGAWSVHKTLFIWIQGDSCGAT